MSTVTKVVHDEGISIAVPDRRLSGKGMMATMVATPLMLMIVMGAGASLVSPAWVVAALLVWTVGMFVSLVMGTYSGFHHIRVGPHAVHLTELRVRTLGAPSQEAIRKGDDSAWILGGRDEEVVYAYSEMTNLGHSKHGLWFDVAGERQELVLSSLSRADIERLAETIRPVWQRAREALQGSAEQADVARRALGQLESPR